MKKDQTVCFNIKACWHAISRMYNEQGQAKGLTTATGYVLLNINVKKGTPATKIAPMIGMEPRSLTRMLKNLEEEGLVYRESDEKDKRMVNVFLTEKGKEKREVARNVVKKFNNHLRKEIEPEKLEIFFEVMKKIDNIIAQKGIY
ncbi:MarR family transcriptional regulator [Cytophagaceae bacterium ABcell3]|nr:MarR family transcriptional regulator [Cytophagaceae bacterium ABcell3]